MITIRQGNIVKEHVDAIVNVINMWLSKAGSVNESIHRFGGPTIMVECKKVGKCKIGEAVLTKAGSLNAQYVIHAMGPIWRGGGYNEHDLLRKCYESSFKLAIEHKLKSLALPAIGTGAYNYPVRDAAKIALRAGKIYEKYFGEIKFICFSKSDHDVYRNFYTGAC